MDNGLKYLCKLDGDLITQFRRQPNTRVLMSAVAKQLQCLYDAQEQLNKLRWLVNAQGKQLDGIGNIVALSREQARKLEKSVFEKEAMDDSRYRDYLKYKMHVNTSWCTYKDVYKALRMFWDKSPLYYAEDPMWPATMFFSTPALKPEDCAERLFRIPVVKAAGVALRIIATTETPGDPAVLRAGGGAFTGVSVTILPPLVWEYHTETSLNTASRMGNVARTVLPLLSSGKEQTE